MTTFTMGKGENFPSVFHFPLVLSFFKLCLWAAESTSAYSSLKYALREKNFQTPSVKYAKGLTQRDSGNPSRKNLGFKWSGALSHKIGREKKPRSRESVVRDRAEDRKWCSCVLGEVCEESFLLALDVPLLSHWKLVMKDNTFLGTLTLYSL